MSVKPHICLGRNSSDSSGTAVAHLFFFQMQKWQSVYYWTLILWYQFIVSQPVPPFWDPFGYCNHHAWGIFHHFTEIPGPTAMLDIEFGSNNFYHLAAATLSLSWSHRLSRLSGRLYPWKLCSSLLTWNKSLNCMFRLCRRCQHNHMYTEEKQACCYS